MSLRMLICASVLFLSGPVAQADDMAYMFGNDQFGTIDLKTGAFSIIANLTQQLIGMGVANGKLYGSNGYGSLYQLNPANGALTLVGASTVAYNLLGSTLTGLYAYAGLYLYSIDPNTGVATQIGNGLLPSCGNGSRSTVHELSGALFCLRHEPLHD